MKGERTFEDEKKKSVVREMKSRKLWGKKELHFPFRRPVPSRCGPRHCLLFLDIDGILMELQSICGGASHQYSILMARRSSPTVSPIDLTLPTCTRRVRILYSVASRILTHHYLHHETLGEEGKWKGKSSHSNASLRTSAPPR